MVAHLWNVLGFGFLVIGTIGIVLPLLPTVVFYIAAAACFARGSERFETWMLNHPTIGPPVRNWRETGAIPFYAKLSATIMIAISYTGIVWFKVTATPILIFVGLCLGAVLLWIWTRPTQ